MVFAISWAASDFVLFEDAGRLDIDSLRSMGALDWLALREKSQWWRLASAPFLHGAWWHLAFNLWALFVLGGSVERGFGRAWWSIVLLVSALGSGLAAMAWGQADMVVGVSGVVFGYGGFLVGRAINAVFVDSMNEPLEGTGSAKSEHSKSLSEDNRREFGVPIRELIFWLGLSIGAGWLWPELSQAGHIGGLLAGLFLGAAGTNKPALALGVAVLASGSAAAGREVVAVPESGAEQERLGYALLAQDRAAEAWPAFDGALSAVGEDDPRRGEWLNASAYARAIGSEDRKEWELGLVLIEESLALSPEDPNRLDTLGWLQCQIGRYEAGMSTLRRAEALSEDGPSEELEEHLQACQRR
jgi:membrane associated rhomboid family serine protease